jgi:hypothetical protein
LSSGFLMNWQPALPVGRHALSGSFIISAWLWAAARQVADRWRLMENASQAFLDVVRKSMRATRRALGVGEIDPALLTCAGRLQYEGFQRRQETGAAIRALADKGHVNQGDRAGDGV